MIFTRLSAQTYQLYHSTLARGNYLFPTLSRTEKYVTVSLGICTVVSHCRAVSFCSLYNEAMLLDTYKFFIFLNCSSLTNMTLISRNIWEGIYSPFCLMSMSPASFCFFTPYFYYFTFNLSVAL